MTVRSDSARGQPACNLFSRIAAALLAYLSSPFFHNCPEVIRQLRIQETSLNTIKSDI
jgi:hypothetical protein